MYPHVHGVHGFDAGGGACVQGYLHSKGRLLVPEAESHRLSEVRGHGDVLDDTVGLNEVSDDVSVLGCLFGRILQLCELHEPREGHRVVARRACLRVPLALALGAGEVIG